MVKNERVKPMLTDEVKDLTHEISLTPKVPLVSAKKSTNIIRYAEFILGLFAIYLTLMLVQRYLTWDFLIPFYQTAVTLSSLNFVVAFLTFLFLFFDTSNIQKRVRNWGQSKIQDSIFPHIFLIASCVIFLVTGLTFQNLTPVHWRSFIDEKFLTGEQDDYASAISEINGLTNIDSSGKDAIIATLGIFKERFQVNNHHSNADWDGVKQKLNLLDVSVVENEYLRTFRTFGLAEGNSLVASQGGSQNAMRLSSARLHYESFMATPLPVITKKWSDSAKNNLANTYYYQQEFQLAIDTWRKLPRNPSTLANISAAFTRLGEYDKAITAADDGLKLLNGNNGKNLNNILNGNNGENLNNSRALLVENMMIAQLSKNDIKEAMNTYMINYLNDGVIPDESLITTYSIVLLLSSNTPMFIQTVRSSSQLNETSRALLWGLHSLSRGSEDDALLKLSKFLGVPAGSLQPTEILEHTDRELTARGYPTVTRLMALIRPH